MPSTSPSTSRKEAPPRTITTRNKAFVIPAELAKRTQAEISEAAQAKKLAKEKELAAKEQKAEAARSKRKTGAKAVAAFEDKQAKQDKVINSLRPDLALKKKEKQLASPASSAACYTYYWLAASRGWSQRNPGTFRHSPERHGACGGLQQR